MRAHPKHIYSVPGGWYVIIKRGPVTYRAFFAFAVGRRCRDASPADQQVCPTIDRPAALARAVAARDKFLLNYPQTYSGQPVRSSTGVQGVSECTKWWHNKPYPCFQVTCGHPKKGIKRFFYKTEADRPRALRAAIAHRKMLEAQASAGHSMLDVGCSMLDVPTSHPQAAHV